MSPMKKPLIVSAVILAVAVPASAVIASGDAGGNTSSTVLRISGNTASFTSILSGVSSGKAAKANSSLFGHQQKIFRLKGHS